MNIKIGFLLFLFPLLLNAQNADIVVKTQKSWPPGKSVPVTVEITLGEAQEFARFYHSLPKGFSVQNINGSGADFFWDNNQVNYVWTDLPDNDIITIQYLVMADMMLTGSFNLTAKFDYVLDDKKRISIQSIPMSIILDKSSVVEEHEINYELTDEQEVINEEEAKIDSPVKPEPLLIDYRIQVSISSQKFSQADLEERINCKLKHGVTILRTGTMYKYQSGTFNNYADAANYLKELKDGGVKDSFIVAFKDNIQISIKEAGELLKK